MSRESSTAAQDSGVRQRHKLHSKAYGPYKVLAKYEHIVKILRDGLVEVVSLDRVAVAPPGSQAEAPGPARHGNSSEYAVPRLTEMDRKYSAPQTDDGNSGVSADRTESPVNSKPSRERKRGQAFP